MAIHSFEEEDAFPALTDAWEGMFLGDDEILCYDSPIAYNFHVGDQVKVRFDDILEVYEVVEVQPATNFVSEVWCDHGQLGYEPDRIRVVTLRQIY